MKKRLRKKLHVGEFQELGFHAEFILPSREKVLIDEYMDAFIDLVEAQGLCCGGGCHPIEGNRQSFGFFVTVIGRGSVTEAQRQAIAGALNSWEQITDVVVEELKDAWYGY